VGSTRRVTTVLVVVAALAAMLGWSGASAEPPGVQPVTTALTPSAGPPIDRLGDLEPLLPEDVPVGMIELDAETTWGSFGGDAARVHAVLSTLEDDLRRLFIEADDADGPAADALALIARGWLDVWIGTAALADHEANDLAFPLGTSNDDGVATGADELRGDAEKGLALVLLGRARHLEGYAALRELGAADPPTQSRFDARAAAAERFDTEVRPLLATLLSHPTPSLAVPGERFVTRAPGIEPRATSLTLVCIDRQQLAEAGSAASEERLPELQAGSPDRADCPDLRGPVPRSDAP
jgi:hypothetical protein